MLTPKELKDKFAKIGADAVFAFQLRYMNIIYPRKVKIKYRVAKIEKFYKINLSRRTLSIHLR